MAGKTRLDLLLVERGLAPTRARAQAMLLAGTVRVNGAAAKAGTLVAPDVVLEVDAPDHPYVSRGGLKLAGALTAFGLDVTGLRALDVGASTGGFTDCLLQRGAAHVVAVDVGYGQLAHKLRVDPRVTVLERTNARTLEPDQIGGAADLTVVDASFIGLGKLMPAVARCTKPGGALVALVKPQFEVGREEASRGRGVVKDDAVRRRAIDAAAEGVQAAGFDVVAEVDSRVRGPKGNLEAFVYAARRARRSCSLERSHQGARGRRTWGPAKGPAFAAPPPPSAGPSASGSPAARRRRDGRRPPRARPRARRRRRAQDRHPPRPRRPVALQEGVSLPRRHQPPNVVQLYELFSERTSGFSAMDKWRRRLPHVGEVLRCRCRRRGSSCRTRGRARTFCPRWRCRRSGPRSPRIFPRLRRVAAIGGRARPRRCRRRSGGRGYATSGASRGPCASSPRGCRPSTPPASSTATSSRRTSWSRARGASSCSTSGSRRTSRPWRPGSEENPGDARVHGARARRLPARDARHRLVRRRRHPLRSAHGAAAVEGSPAALLLQKQHDTPPPPSALANGVPEHLEQLAMELLRIDPRARPSGDEIAARLSGAQAERASPSIDVPFVGREAEQSRLAAAFEASKAKTGVVLLRGPSGMGKTALAARFLATLSRDPRNLVVSGRCYEREAVPFKAVDSVVDELSEWLTHLRIAERETLRPPTSPALARIFPVLSDMAARGTATEGAASDEGDSTTSSRSGAQARLRRDARAVGQPRRRTAARRARRRPAMVRRRQRRPLRGAARGAFATVAPPRLRLPHRSAKREAAPPLARLLAAGARAGDRVSHHRPRGRAARPRGARARDRAPRAEPRGARDGRRGGAPARSSSPSSRDGPRSRRRTGAAPERSRCTTHPRARGRAARRGPGAPRDVERRPRAVAPRPGGEGRRGRREERGIALALRGARLVVTRGWATPIRSRPPTTASATP